MGCSGCGNGSNCGGDCGGSCADGCNSCGGPVKVITKQGLQGDPGSIVLYANYAPEATPSVGPFVDSEFSTLKYTVPEVTLKNNGDILKIKALFHKRLQVGAYSFEMYFGTEKITYDYTGALKNNAASMFAEIEITRISNTDVLVVGRTTIYGGDGTTPEPSVTINTLDVGTGSTEEALRKTVLSGLDLTANTYDISGKASADSNIADPFYMHYMTVEKVSV